ncbi:uncharacterized protein EV422DRAFT_406686 [Fimicolochytrium jonesii]|uniref:uncharacterized protein n=1 Tax=Fimicolochytrium jonesii TaxID=1396493 RepID=UPI0022FE54AA|nr:uncharacterized protein EV422DRAFT_406686 [Fimicolochytrium jonesii]KAI8822606.1 hypothetical protein EV422DRAFT_406686 [Fimicolochytrium jonesii]
MVAFSSWRYQAWIATYTLLALWGFLWLLAHTFRGLGRPLMGGATGAGLGGAAGGGPGALEGGTAGTAAGAATGGKHPHGWRVQNAARIARNSFLMSLAATVINELGFGITRTVAALIWTFFALSILHIFAAMATRHYALPWLVGFPQYVIIMIAVGLAFRG